MPIQDIRCLFRSAEYRPLRHTEGSWTTWQASPNRHPQFRTTTFAKAPEGIAGFASANMMLSKSAARFRAETTSVSAFRRLFERLASLTIASTVTTIAIAAGQLGPRRVCHRTPTSHQRSSQESQQMHPWLLATSRTTCSTPGRITRLCRLRSEAVSAAPQRSADSASRRQGRSLRTQSAPGCCTISSRRAASSQNGSAPSSESTLTARTTGMSFTRATTLSGRSASSSETASSRRPFILRDF